MRDYTPVQPEWDLGYIQQCNAGCQSAYPIEFGRKNYNVCYTCICLIGAAEDAGELVSAQAQCEDAQGW